MYNDDEPWFQAYEIVGEEYSRSTGETRYLVKAQSVWKRRESVSRVDQSLIDDWEVSAKARRNSNAALNHGDDVAVRNSHRILQRSRFDAQDTDAAMLMLGCMLVGVLRHQPLLHPNAESG